MEDSAQVGESVRKSIQWEESKMILAVTEASRIKLKLLSGRRA